MIIGGLDALGADAPPAAALAAPAPVVGASAPPSARLSHVAPSSLRAARRSRRLSELCLEVSALPALAPSLGAPLYLRGTALAYFSAKQRLGAAVLREMGSVGDAFGFSADGVATASERLVSDLTGGGGPPRGDDDAVVELHEAAFENFNCWALMVGGRCVFSARLAEGGVSGVTAAELAGPAAGAAMARAEREGGAPPPPPPLPYAARGAPRERLVDLCLFYCISAECANLRFMPELCAWLFHQMRFAFLPPARPLAAGFFASATVAPIYAHLKRGAKLVAPAPRWQALLPCCGRAGPRRLPNAARLNYDDFNERFWEPSCLLAAHHAGHAVRWASLDVLLAGVGKTFPERAGWASVALSLWRWLALQATLLHAVALVAEGAVAAGGGDLAAFVTVPVLPLALRALGSFETVAVAQVALVLLGEAHGGGGHSGGCGARAARAAYALGWAAALLFFSFTGLGGRAAWLALVAARLLCLAVAEGLPPFCALARRGALRGLLRDLEGGWWPGLPPGAGGAYAYAGAVAARAPRCSGGAPPAYHVCGDGFMVQPLSRVRKYGSFWGVVLLAKLAFDTQSFIQQVRLVATVQGAALAYAAPWGFSALGVRHFLLVAFSWACALLLALCDTYVAFVLVAPLVGYAACAADGLGALREGTDVAASFLRGLPGGSAGSRGRPLAEQFAAVAAPLARGRGVEAATVFRRAWDAFVVVLREEDMVSNEEACRLMYGDGVGGASSNQLPLFMYAGVFQQFLERVDDVVDLALHGEAEAAAGGGGDGTAASAAAFAAEALLDAAHDDALSEIVAGLPHILAHAACSHSAIGFRDAHALPTLSALFAPPPGGGGLRAAAARLLGPPLVWDGVSPAGLRAARWRRPQDALREAAALTARVMVAFERDDAGTGRLRGSQLLPLVVELLTLLADLWGLPPLEGVAVAAAVAPAAAPAAARPPAAAPSLAGPTLGALAREAMGGGGAAAAAAAASPLTSGGSSRASSASLACAPLDTRTVRGIVALLGTPNDGGGALDAGGGEAIGDALEVLRECARRIFCLLTMEEAHGTLACEEAERRLSSFVNNMYMPQVPRIASPLHMPSFAVVTPHYAEAVLYGRPFLEAPNAQGVSPLTYLRALHPLEWANLLERLGADSAAGAWAAVEDPAGDAVSGALEVRTWASKRGQTLARTVHGLMQGARALRLLAGVQLELEYGQLEAEKPPGAPRLAAAQVEEDAALAALWWVRERFSYVLAAQRFGEHGEEDVQRRAEIEALLLRHPLLSVAFWEWEAAPPPPPPPSSPAAPAVAPSTPAAPPPPLPAASAPPRRRLTTVLRSGHEGVRFRLPCPGNPVADGIGEGKPHNQLNATIFARGRVIQTIDMNQDAAFESLLLLPNALSLILPRVGPGGSDSATRGAAFGAASRRPLVCLGLREHIYTGGLSTPSFFMAQQEQLFGTMWQRVMASPLRARLHYGHPDLFDAVWISTRGGTSKGSTTINVSEDMFAGFTVALRGGESGHINFLPLGKGRDVGILQIFTFEAKISGGTAISATTRDSFRAFAAADLPRLLSFFHTGVGFYIVNVFIVLSMMLLLYYFAFLSLSGALLAIQQSNSVYLVGNVSLLQWVLQLGLLSVFPLAVLYTLEHGPVRAARRVLGLFASLSPLFFIFEIETKAYFFDQALAFGCSAYAATGRDFVIRHVSFVETFRATAHSHLYLGGEVAVLLGVITYVGVFDNAAQYTFFFLPSWFFCASLLLAPFFFNPFAFDAAPLRADRAAFLRWLLAERGGADECWRTWHLAAGEGAYAQASLATRAWRLLRVSRLLFLGALLAARLGTPPDGALLAFAAHAALPWANIAALQLVAALAPHLPRRDAAARRTACCPFLQPLAAALRAVLLAAAAFCALVVLPSLGLYRLEGGAGVGWVLLAQLVLHAWAARVAVIANMRPLRGGAAAVWQLLDAMLGACLLTLQTALSLLPLAATLQSRAMFAPRYSSVAALTAGNKEALERFGGSGPPLEGLQFSTATAGGAGGRRRGGSNPVPGPIARLLGAGTGAAGGAREEPRPNLHARDRQFRLRRALQAVEGGAPAPLSQPAPPADGGAAGARLGGVAEAPAEPPHGAVVRLETVLSAARAAAASRARAEVAVASASAPSPGPSGGSARGRAGGVAGASAHSAAGGGGGGGAQRDAPTSAFAAARRMFEKKD